MGQPNQYYSDFNLNHEQVYAENEKLKSENHQLRKKLSKKRDRIKGQDRYISKLERKVKEKNGDEQHYRNGRKRGSRGFKG